MKKVRFGVIGCGVMGGHHARILSDLKEAKLVGVFDVDPDRSAPVSQSLNTQAFPDLASLLSECEAVSLSTPTSTHFELGMSCLGSHTHLLIEKPIALNSLNGQALVNEAASQGVVLGVGMIERFNPAYTALRRLIKNDRILGINIKRFSPFPARITDASVVMDMMIHDLDLARDLSFAELDSVKAQGLKSHTDKLDEASAKLFFKDGLIVTVDASRLKSDKLRLITVTTNKAIYEADLLAKKLYQRNFEKLSDKLELDTKPADQLTQELRDFCVSIRRGRPPLVPGSQGVIALKLAEEVEKLCS